MKRTSQTLPPKLPPKFGTLGGKNLPTPKGKGYIIYTPFPFVRYFGRFSPPPLAPFWEFLGVFGRLLFLTAALIVAEVLSAGASLTAPNYEPTFCPTQGASVFRTRVRPFPVLGFSLETTKMNERTETAETTSPRPWQIIRRETKATKTCHHKSHTYALVDANGRDVWHTLANMRLICAAVNGNRHQ